MELPKKSKRLSSRRDSAASMLFDPKAFYGFMFNSMFL